MSRQASTSPQSGTLKPPAPQAWAALAELSQHARESLDQLGLPDWDFAYDRAVRRIGCCDSNKKRITLSRAFVTHYLGQGASKQSIIQRVLLHEIAHALAWTHHRARGHGATWQHYCRLLGIEGESSRTQCDPFESPQARYALIHRETKEIFYYYMRKPRISAKKLQQYYIPHQKASSLGQLQIISIQDIPKA